MQSYGKQEGYGRSEKLGPILQLVYHMKARDSSVGEVFPSIAPEFLEKVVQSFTSMTWHW